MKRRFPFFNKTRIACTSETILHLSNQFPPTTLQCVASTTSFFEFPFFVWADDEPGTKDEPVYGLWDGLLNSKSFFPSAVVCDGTTHVSRSFNSTLIRSRILVKFQLFSLLFLLSYGTRCVHLLGHQEDEVLLSCFLRA